MFVTPDLEVDEYLILRPASKGVLPEMLEAYHEDSQAAQTALPWLNPSDDIRRQLRDMLYDIESQHGTDRLHFWSIHDQIRLGVPVIHLLERHQLRASPVHQPFVAAHAKG